MSRKFLLVGNSHLACVKVAMDIEPGLLGGRTVDYVAFNQIDAADFDVVEGIIKPPTNTSAIPSDARLGEARATDYSGFVIVGMGLSINLLASIYLSHRLLAHHRQGLHLLSRAAFDSAVAESIQKLGVNSIIAKLRAATNVPVLLVPEPLMNAEIAKDERGADVWTGEHAPFLVERYISSLHQVFDPVVDLLEQPPETIDGVFTRAEYAYGGLRSLTKRDKRGNPWRYKEDHRDYRHMNEQYGAIICRRIENWLTSRGL